MRRKLLTALSGLAALIALTGTGLTTAQAADTARPAAAPRPHAITLHPVTVKHGAPEVTIPRNRRGTGKLGGGNLQYNGGPVQKDPQVFVLFWGSWWSSTCSDTQGFGATDESYLYSLYNGLGTVSDNLSPITSQYGDSTGTFPIYPTVAGQAFITWNADCTDPPAAATDAQLAAEATAYASALAGEGYTISNDTQIIVVSPSGTNPGGGFGSGYCAYHNWAQYSSSQLLSWTNLPYIPDQGSNCGANLVQNGDDGWSIVGGHEYAESVTDPFVNNQTAWADNQGYEIGDKCAWTNLFTQTTSTGTFAMQPEWDNHTSACQPTSTYPRGRVKLYNSQTHCMDDSHGSLANWAKVDLSTCNGWTRQQWVGYPDGSLRRSLNTGQCVNIVNHKSANGTLIDLYRCNGGWNQIWKFSSSSHEWVNPHTGKCLRDPQGSLTNGTQLELWTCISNFGSEKWTNV
jgi:Ricin-type beta-trefoil lectin domain